MIRINIYGLFLDRESTFHHMGTVWYFTRRSGRYVPILLAAVEGWSPSGHSGGLRPPVGLQCPNLELQTLKIGNFCNFDRNFTLFTGKIWLWLFYNYFCFMVQRFYTKNLKSFQLKMKVWWWFSRILISFWIGKIQRHAFIFAQNDLRFFV